MTRYIKYKYLALVFPWFFIVAKAAGQDTTPNQRGKFLIEGTIRDSLTAYETLLEGVEVRLVGNGQSVFTDKDGYFQIFSETGEEKLLVQTTGYFSKELEIFNGVIQTGRHNKKVINMELDVTHIKKLDVGDSLPEHLLMQSFSLLNEEKNRTLISLRELSHQKLVVIDFWASWCKPCVEAIDGWHERKKGSPYSDFALLGVLVGGDYERNRTFLVNRGWTAPNICGREFLALSAYFFDEPHQVGGQVWILDGKIVFVGHAVERREEAQKLASILSEIF